MYAVAARCAGSFASLFQDVIQIAQARAQRRQQATKNSRGEADAGRERQHRKVDARLANDRKPRWGESPQGLDSGRREQQASTASTQRKQNTFGQQLPDEPPVLGAERRAQRQ